MVETEAGNKQTTRKQCVGDTVFVYCQEGLRHSKSKANMSCVKNLEAAAGALLPKKKKPKKKKSTEGTSAEGKA